LDHHCDIAQVSNNRLVCRFSWTSACDFQYRPCRGQSPRAYNMFSFAVLRVYKGILFPFFDINWIADIQRVHANGSKDRNEWDFIEVLNKKQICWIYIPRRILVITNTTTEDIRLYLYIYHGINSYILSI
jgi:hypothetical protein